MITKTEVKKVKLFIVHEKVIRSKFTSNATAGKLLIKSHGVFHVSEIFLQLFRLAAATLSTFQLWLGQTTARQPYSALEVY